MAKRTEPIDIEIGRRIRIHRETAGLSQTDLGNLTGVTFQQIQKYEKGSNRCSGSRLVRIATALKCKPADLFGDGTTNGKKSPATGILEQMNEPGAIAMVQAFNSMPSKFRTLFTHLMLEVARLR
jgi:transcriptional regulator with XRE-family HTH domain